MKTPLLIKIAAAIIVLWSFLLIPIVIANINYGFYGQTFWSIFSILINIFIAWGIYKLKKWAFPVGLLSQIAGIANLIITLPVVLSTFQGLPQPLPPGFYVFFLIVNLPLTASVIFVSTVLILKRKDFVQ